MMELVDDIKLYLPQYLSSEGQNVLKEELAKFPFDGTKDTIYTCALDGADYLLQGDGIAEMPYLMFPDDRKGKVPALLLSNTCDMSVDNKRMYPSRIMYAPIISLEKFESKLRTKYPDERVDALVNAIKKQHISQILYLPKGCNLSYEAIVFFDRAISVPISSELVKEMCQGKLFTLSNFGFYLFLLKISIHFTRVQERIDRATGKDLGGRNG